MTCVHFARADPDLFMPLIFAVSRATTRCGSRIAHEIGLRFEDSPGNFIVERNESPASVTYVGFDAAGAAHREQVWWPDDPPKKNSN
jgi:hypothetical protein